MRSKVNLTRDQVRANIELLHDQGDARTETFRKLGVSRKTVYNGIKSKPLSDKNGQHNHQRSHLQFGVEFEQ